MRTKRSIVLSVLAGAAVLAPTIAQAAPTRVCYLFDNYPEYLDLIVNDPVAGHYSVYGRWGQAGVGSGGLAGAYERNEVGSGRRFSLTGTLKNSNGVLAVSLDATPNGPWALRMIGNDGSSFATNGTNFHKVSCRNPLPAAAESSGLTTDPQPAR